MMGAHDNAPGDDGAPDIRHAEAWLQMACQELTGYAHEHNDSRILDVVATLRDITERATILPREVAASLALAAADERSELDASGRDCDGQRDRGPDVLEQARELGRQAGRAAGSWAADGNTSAEHIRKVLAMLDVGDPAADDFLPRTPNLSGEYADDVTAHSIASELLGNDQTPEDRDAIADAWEEGVSETFVDACVSTLRGFLPDDDVSREGEQA